MKNINLVNKTKSIFKLQVTAAFIFTILVLCLGGIFIWKNIKYANSDKPEVKAAETKKADASEQSNVSATPEKKPIPKTKPKTVTASSIKTGSSKSTIKAQNPTNTAKTYVAPKPAKTAPKPTTPANGIYTIANAQIYVENQIIALVNAERAKKGLGRLTPVAKLNQAADIRAKEETFLANVNASNHTRPNGSTFNTVFAQVGYTGCSLWGENLVDGYQGSISLNATQLKAVATKMFNLWKNSPGHYANIIKACYNQTGVGVVLVNSGGRLYYLGIQEFARR